MCFPWAHSRRVGDGGEEMRKAQKRKGEVVGMEVGRPGSLPCPEQLPPGPACSSLWWGRWVLLSDALCDLAPSQGFSFPICPVKWGWRFLSASFCCIEPLLFARFHAGLGEHLDEQGPPGAGALIG